MIIAVIALIVWCLILSCLALFQHEDLARLDRFQDTQLDLWRQQNRLDEQLVNDIEKIEEREQKGGA
jgi:hypothetical protein